MTWRTHELFGIASLWLLAPIPGILTSNTIGPLCALAAIGALVPDLDASASKFARWTWAAFARLYRCRV